MVDNSTSKFNNNEVNNNEVVNKKTETEKQSPEEIVRNITANELTKVPGLPSSTINKIISFFRNPTKKPYQTTDPNDPKLSE